LRPVRVPEGAQCLLASSAGRESGWNKRRRCPAAGECPCSYGRSQRRTSPERRSVKSGLLVRANVVRCPNQKSIQSCFDTKSRQVLDSIFDAQSVDNSLDTQRCNRIWLHTRVTTQETRWVGHAPSAQCCPRSDTPTVKFSSSCLTSRSVQFSFAALELAIITLTHSGNPR